MKIHTLAALLALTALAGCGDSAKIKDAVKEQLNDPSSVQFKEVLVQGGKRACAVWNAKNGMGGYGGWKVAELRKVEGVWQANDMDGYEGCDADRLKLDLIVEQQTYAGARMALQIIQKSANYTGQEKGRFSALDVLLEAAEQSNMSAAYVLYGPTGQQPCAKAIQTYADAHASIAKADLQGKPPTDAARKVAALRDAQSQLESGSCK